MLGGKESPFHIHDMQPPEITKLLGTFILQGMGRHKFSEIGWMRLLLFPLSPRVLYFPYTSSTNDRYS
jgi:hypothetical protein